jgi:hypothetical protein
MNDNPAESIDDLATSLATKLASLRRAKADVPEAERRDAFRRTLHDELAELPAESADRVVERVRELLIAEGRARDERVAQLNTQVSQLEARITEMSAERDRLLEENASLQSEPSAVGAPVTDSSAVLTRLREGLLKASQGEGATADSVGVTATEAGLFRLVQGLLEFALKYELGLNLLLAEFKIGPAADADTKLARGMREQVRERFRACLENEEGSVDALKEALERNARFLIDLNRAYQASLYEGNRAMIAELDPHPLLTKHKRALMGIDYEAATKSMSRLHADMSNLARDEIWERYFVEPFREELSTYLGQDG